MSDVPPSEATRLLRAVRAGAATRDDVTPRLVELMYPELRALAARLMRGERSGHTLQHGDSQRGVPGAHAALSEQ